MARLIPSFCIAYLAGVFCLVWMDLNIFGLGDPKFRTSADIYFPLWSAIYSPTVITAFVFLWRTRLRDWRLWQLAGAYLLLILVVLEISFILDIGWVVLLVEFVIFALLFRMVAQVSGVTEQAKL